MSIFSQEANNRTVQQGFTLVEMSIVLVIIGLILGGVLVGQDLIRQGEITSLTTQIHQYQTAMNTFYTKYNAFPGDIASADTIIPGAVSSGGNNDGVLDAGSLPTAAPTTIPASSTPSEFLGFWNHLGAAGMIEGTFSGASGSVVLPNSGAQPNVPGLKTGRGGFFVYGLADRKNYMQLGAVASGTTITTSNNLRPDEAFGIDKKIDDGNPNSGNILARGGTALEVAPSAGAGAGSYCVTSTTATGAYNTVNTQYLCQLRVKLN